VENVLAHKILAQIISNVLKIIVILLLVADMMLYLDVKNN